MLTSFDHETFSGKWNWFMAVNYYGKWIETNGLADMVSVDEETFSAVLRFCADGEPYSELLCKIEREDITGRVKSSDPRVPDFSVLGKIHTTSLDDGEQCCSLLFTDGITILCLAKGRNSGEPNLAN